MVIFTGDLENTEQNYVFPLYITISFLIHKLRFLVRVSISNFQKLIEQTDRKVERYSRPGKHYELIQHN